ncbi:MAG: hypothetical protein HY664_04295 [Chloroflexi bacterium]|nr:hypothetical protein [Chloroflexota bacterium]
MRGMAREGFWAQWWRVAGVAGIVFVILFMVGMGLQGDAPSHEDSASEIAAWFTDNGKLYIVGDYLIGLGVVLFFLPFLVALRSLLGEAEGGAGIWSRLAFVGGVVVVTLGGALSAFQGALAYGFGVVGEGDEATVLTMLYATFYQVTSLMLVVAFFLLASSWVIWRTAVLWRWLAGLGLVVAVLGIITPLAQLDANPEGTLSIFGFIAFLGFPLWVLLVSIAMITKKSLPAARS